MRATIRIDDQLLQDVREEAAKRGKTLSAFVEDALREVLLRRRQARTPAAVQLQTAPGKPMPGVNLDSNAELLDLMDEGLPIWKLR